MAHIMLARRVWPNSSRTTVAGAWSSTHHGVFFEDLVEASQTGTGSLERHVGMTPSQESSVFDSIDEGIEELKHRFR